MHLEIVGLITHIETIARGASLRARRRLDRLYGPGEWRKREGIATVRLSVGSLGLAELHWEAHGIGSREYKIKKYIN